MHRLLVIGLVVWLMSSSTALAQDAPELIVTLKDVSDAPLAGATVIIRDSSGSRDIARATTDTQGVATFSTLMETDIRVVIQGRLPNGATYFQPGNDAKGIAMHLSCSVFVAICGRIVGRFGADYTTFTTRKGYFLTWIDC